VNFRKQVRD